MIFFTRSLYDQLQEGSNSQRRAERLWDRYVDVYGNYLGVISPFLPKPLLGILNFNLHDGKILEADQQLDRLMLVVDATHSDGRYSGKVVRMDFQGVQGRIRKNLQGSWWLYEEAHLEAGGLFALQVLCREREFEIVAKSVRVTARLS